MPVSVREVLPSEVARTASEELLTTGEAAKLLNTSRQHVVNLCNQGDLPYTTVGTHRRIRRRDLELVRNRSNKLSRDQRRSLWLAYAVAGKIVEDPEAALTRATRNLATMRESARGQARHWLDEWEQLIDGPLEELLISLVSPSPRSRELRQNNPFAGLLDQETRQRALDNWREVIERR